MLIPRAARRWLLLLALITTIIFLLHTLKATPNSSQWQIQQKAQPTTARQVEQARFNVLYASCAKASTLADVSHTRSIVPAPTRFLPVLENITYLTPSPATSSTSSPVPAFATIRIVSEHTITHTHSDVLGNRPFHPQIDLPSTAKLYPRSIGDHDYLSPCSLTTPTTTKTTGPINSLTLLLHNLPITATTATAPTATPTTPTTPNSNPPLYPRESPTLCAFGITLAGLFVGVGIGLIVKACCQPGVMSWAVGDEAIDRSGQGYGSRAREGGRRSGWGIIRLFGFGRRLGIRLAGGSYR